MLKVIALLVFLSLFNAEVYSANSDIDDSLKSYVEGVKKENYTNNGKLLAYDDLLVRAQTGDETAQILVVFMLYTGKGVTKDQEESFRWLIKVADKGNPVAQYNAGLFYETGVVVDIKLEIAAKYYGLAAARGYSHAQYKLGVWYLNGVFFNKDIQLSEEWLIKSASQDNIAAITQLVRLYYKEQKPNQLLKWVQKGIENGSANAIYISSMLYRNGFLSIKIDIKKANEQLVMAAESGSPQAQHKLGVYYREGVFFDKSPERAFFWFSKSANQGYADANLAIGLMYFDGEYVKQDYQKAISLFEEVAAQDNVDAYSILAMAYIGPDTEIYDIEKAKYWMKKAADAGDQMAIELLKDYEVK